MIELGVGMVAICLRTLRPLFHGWSPESIIRSVRSAISLRSVYSGGSSARISAGPSVREIQALGSESSVAGINMEEVTKGKANTDDTNTLDYEGEESSSRTESRDGGVIKRDRSFVQSRQEV